MHWECYMEVQLRSYGTHNHRLAHRSLNNKPANHYVVTRLHKGASTDIAQN